MDKIKNTQIREDLEVNRLYRTKTSELVGTYKTNGEQKSNKTSMEG